MPLCSADLSPPFTSRLVSSMFRLLDLFVALHIFSWTGCYLDDASSAHAGESHRADHQWWNSSTVVRKESRGTNASVKNCHRHCGVCIASQIHDPTGHCSARSILQSSHGGTYSMPKTRPRSAASRGTHSMPKTNPRSRRNPTSSPCWHGTSVATVRRRTAHSTSGQRHLLAPRRSSSTRSPPATAARRRTSNCR